MKNQITNVPYAHGLEVLQSAFTCALHGKAPELLTDALATALRVALPEVGHGRWAKCGDVWHVLPLRAGERGFAVGQVVVIHRQGKSSMRRVIGGVLHVERWDDSVGSDVVDALCLAESEVWSGKLDASNVPSQSHDDFVLATMLCDLGTSPEWHAVWKYIDTRADALRRYAARWVAASSGSPFAEVTL